MKVMIAGGGTGGHVFPGMAIAEEFRRRDPRTEIVWVGTAHGFETRMGALLGCPLEVLPVAPVLGRGVLGGGKAIWRTLTACGQARRLIRRWQPNVVIGVGGYISVPTVLAAFSYGCPTLLHEQNRVAGWANRFLGRFTCRVCVTFPDAIRFFPRRKTMWTGNPVRARTVQEFASAPEKQGNEFVVLVFGGSQGARALDQVVLDALPRLQSHASQLRFIHQVGRGTDVGMVQQQYAAAGVRVEVHHFIDAIGPVYKQADLVICRAGASTVTELMLVGRPAVIIPYPHAGNHQLWNARYLGDAGAAIVREEHELSGVWLAEEIQRLINDPARCRAMATAARQLARPDAAEKIVDTCMQMCVEHV